MSSLELCPRCGFNSGVPLPVVADATLQSPLMQELVNSNIAPSETDAIYLRSLASRHAQILLDMDTQISKAESALATLRQERQTMAAEITRFRAITSPIRRLPTEILSKVFLACIEDRSWDCQGLARPSGSLRITETPWVLTRVCKRWRQIGVSLAKLWSCIVLDMKNTMNITGAVSALELYLQRSYGNPLSVSLTWYYDTVQDHPLFRIILASSCRWEKLMVKAPSGLERLDSIQGCLPLLHDLHLDITHIPNTINTFELAPSLRAVRFSSLEQGEIHLQCLLPFKQILRYSKCTFCQSLSSDPLSVLTLCPNLQECRFFDMATISTASCSPLTLPYLRVLTVNGFAWDSDAMAALLTLMTAPSLMELTLNTRSLYADSLVSCLRRSKPPLIKLRVLCAFENDALLGLLDEVPTLQELDIDGIPSLSNGVLRGLTHQPGVENMLVPSLSRLTIHGRGLEGSSRLFAEMLESRCQKSVDVCRLAELQGHSEAIEAPGGRLQYVHVPYTRSAKLAETYRNLSAMGLEVWSGGSKID